MGKASCRASGKTQGPHPAHPCRSELLLRLQGRILRAALAGQLARRSLGEGWALVFGPSNDAPGVSVRSGRVRLVHPEAEELFALDEALRAEGRRVLADSGIGAIIDEAGFAPVGSQVMRTMTWRDLDFERPEATPDWQEHWEIGRRLAMTGWCVRMVCTDNHRAAFGIRSLYWGLRVADPARTEPIDVYDRNVWKVDLHSLPPEDVEANAQQAERWTSRMTEEDRANIIAIKKALCYGPEYRRTVFSVHIYQAVLEHGVQDLPAFRRWWEENVRAGGHPRD